VTQPKYLIVTWDCEVYRTDNKELAQEYASDDTNNVIDVEQMKWMDVEGELQEITEAPELDDGDSDD